MDGLDTTAPDLGPDDTDLRTQWVADQLADLAELRALTMGMARRVAEMQGEICADLKPTPEAVRAEVI